MDKPQEPTPKPDTSDRNVVPRAAVREPSEPGKSISPPPDQALTFDQTEAYDAERKYLEGLLNARLNFYMVFASLLIAGLLGSDAVTPEFRLMGSIFGAAVSVMIGVSVWRTHRLVSYIVERIHSTRKHPYAEARVWVERNEPRVRRTNANAAFARIPILVGWLFIFIALLTLADS